MKKFTEFTGKKVVIWGLGQFGNGPAAARFFAENGADVLVTDLKLKEELSESLKLLADLPQIKYVLGEHQEDDFLNADIVFRLPGIPKENPLLKKVLAAGVQVVMSEGFFIKHSPTQNIIGITGTKGKTTTANLVAQVLKANRLNVHLAGIPQKSAMSLLDKVKKDDWVVLEISSWDCEGLDYAGVSPQFAIITNISQDHLNRYSSYKNYAMSKSAIFKYQNPKDLFLTIKDGEFTKDYLGICKSNSILVDKDNLGYDFSGAKLKGIHNKINMAFALKLAESIGLDIEKSLRSVKSFTGVPYRQERIGSIDGIEFINDTTATAPSAATEAINTFLDKNPVVILGGHDKDLDYSQLINHVIKTGVKYILLSGSGTEKYIELGLSDENVYEDFELAVRAAYKMARDIGGVVLLSPGTASFGMFKNEFDRGDQFNQIFQKLKNEIEN